MNDDRLVTDLGSLRLQNPVVVGSSELSMTLSGIERLCSAGVGGIVVKSVNESAAAHRQLAIADYQYLAPDRTRRDSAEASLRDGLINRSGLGSGDIDEWREFLEQAVRAAAVTGTTIIGSVTLGDPAAVGDLVSEICAVTEHIELNVGAPHAHEDVAGAVRSTVDGDQLERIVAEARTRCDGTLIVKLPEPAWARDALVAACVRGGADVVTLHGRSNGFMPDLESFEPILGSWGAYSSPGDLPRSLYHLSKAYKDFGQRIRFCGTNGIRDSDDIVRAVLSGASFVEMTTAFWINGPDYARALIAGLSQFLESRDIGQLSELVGRSVESAREYSEITASAPQSQTPWKQWI